MASFVVSTNGVVPMKSKTLNEILIDKIKNHRYLFDKSDTRYKDYSLKKNRWAVIAAEMGLTPADAKRKWKSLRDRFVRERRLTKHPAAQTQPKPTLRWNLYHRMEEFLEHVIPYKQDGVSNIVEKEDEDSSSSLPCQISSTYSLGDLKSEDRVTKDMEEELLSEVTSNSEVVCKKEDISFLEETTDNEELSYPHETSDDTDVSNKEMTPNVGVDNNYGESRKRKKCDVASPPPSKIRKESFVSRPNYVLNDVKDDTYHYCMSIMPRLRNLPYCVQHRVRLKMEQIILEEEEKIENTSNK